MKYDFIAIGDVVTDAFIRLLPESATVIDGGSNKLCFGYGDKIPFERAFIIPGVGNSANAAVAAARLGLSSAFVSNIGDDVQGIETLKALERNEVKTEFISKNKGKTSNYHYVLWYKDDRTILIKHEDYEYHLPAFEEPRWIYFSSVGEGKLHFHEEIAEYIRQHPSVKLAFQPGTFQIKVGAATLANVYKATELFVCNKEESQLILNTSETDISKLMRMMHDLGPRVLAITDGKYGAYASDGKTIWFMPPYPDPKPPYERTGAGDAFASTFTAAFILGLPVAEALRWAPINSMSVVQYVGAQEGLLRKSQLERYLKEAPADYQPKIIGTL